MKSNMTGGFTPIAKDGPVTLEIDGHGRAVITDGITTSWVVFEPRGNGWKLDGPLAATGRVREALHAVAAVVAREVKV